MKKEDSKFLTSIKEEFLITMDVKVFAMCLFISTVLPVQNITSYRHFVTDLQSISPIERWARICFSFLLQNPWSHTHISSIMDLAVNVELDSISFCLAHTPTCDVHSLSLLLDVDKFDFKILRLG